MTQLIKGPLKEIHFVTGKGGVGKSTYAALLAQEFAQRKKKTLLVEIGERSFYSTLFNETVKYEPLKISPYFEVSHWSPHECLKRYILSLVKVEAIYNLFFENPVSKALIQVAPSLNELAVMGQITAGSRQHGPHGDHEVLVVDAYATGHFLNLIKAPLAMAETVPVGPMHEQNLQMDKTLRVPNHCFVHIVTLAEDLVLTESQELYEELKRNFSWKPHYILNRYLETTLKSDDLEGSDQVLLQALQNKLLQQKNALETLEKADSKVRRVRLVPKIQGLEDLAGLA